MRRLDAQIRDTRARLTAAVRASGTSLTQIFGVGPVIAAAIIARSAIRAGSVIGTASLPTTAPRRSRSPRAGGGSTGSHCAATDGLNHAIHMAAATQIRHTHSPGRAYFEKKTAAGKTRKEAFRVLKRQLSDVIYARLQADAARGAPAQADGPGRAIGEWLCLLRDRLTPRHRLFGQATPGPQPAYDQPSRPGGQCQRRRSRTAQNHLTTMRSSFWTANEPGLAESAIGQIDRSAPLLADH